MDQMPSLEGGKGSFAGKAGAPSASRGRHLRSHLCSKAPFSSQPKIPTKTLHRLLCTFWVFSSKMQREKGSWRDRQRIWLALFGLWLCFPLSQRPTPFPRRWDQVQQTRRGAGDDSWEAEPGLNSHKVDFIIFFIINILVPRAWLSTHEPLSKYLQPHL